MIANTLIQEAVGAREPDLSVRPMALRDVRLKRELAHRHLAISIVRRFARVITLHGLDGSLLAGAIYLLGTLRADWEVQAFIPAIVAVFLLSLNALSAYSPGDARRDYRRLRSGVCLAVLSLGCLATFPPRLPFSVPFLISLGVVAFLLLTLGRLSVDQLVRQVYKRGFGLRRALMVGNLEEISAAIGELRDDRNIDQFLVGHVALPDEPDPTAIGRLPELPEILEKHGVQEVIVATSLPPKLIRWVADSCFERGAMLYVVPSVVTATDCRAEPLRMGGCPLLRLHPARLELPSLLLKRIFDLCLAIPLLLLLAPVMGLIALAIRMESPGPVFFPSKRVGLGGNPFTMWKFRSMYMDAEAREKDLAHLNIYANGTFKLANDPRVTRVGRVLRRMSMDELPQLFNVVIGNMSMVGPRPALAADLARYKPHHYERLTVIPGITGPWQVNGRNLITNFETIIRMERAYIRSWSLALDAKILLRTLKVVIRGEGAY